MQILTKSTLQTISIGRRVARRLKPGSVVALIGNLGSGKTTFVKGLAQGLGIKKESVNSPSFVLVKEYNAKIPLYHFDLYRIKNLTEVFNIGYEEYLAKGGVVVIEWADRIKDVLPKGHLKINFIFYKEKERLIKFTAHGRDYKRILKEYEDLSD